MMKEGKDESSRMLLTWLYKWAHKLLPVDIVEFRYYVFVTCMAALCVYSCEISLEKLVFSIREAVAGRLKEGQDKK